MNAEGLVSERACAEVSARIFAKLDSMERRLFKDNGSVSIQTRLDRHEQVLRVLLWVTSVAVGTALSAGVLGLVMVLRRALAGGAA